MRNKKTKGLKTHRKETPDGASLLSRIKKDGGLTVAQSRGGKAKLGLSSPDKLFNFKLKF